MPASPRLMRCLSPVALRRNLRRLLDIEQVDEGCWTIHLVGDRVMKQVHERTLRDSSTTDVITLDYRTRGAKGGRRAALDLESFVCVAEARRQAKRRGHSPEHELLLYLVHSLLHVQGYDDRTAPAAQRMHRREDYILVALGIGPVYARPTAVGKSRRLPKHRTGKARTSGRR
ncbi:MAG: rRNA maturation RNase YbeY [Phycisphaerales bacterium]|nr:rRNA maturation RNase YbeY [Phycisphaerales bacterium]